MEKIEILEVRKDELTRTRMTEHMIPALNFEKKALLFWHDAALRSRASLKFDHVTGMEGMQSAYGRVLNGESAPDRGVIVAL